MKRSRHEPRHKPLARAELPVDTAALARFLIGKLLVRELPEGAAIGRIVETEACVIGDAAGHAYPGTTPRNGSLFLERGHAYVYLAYGLSWMLNVSSEAKGSAGVLIQALEPLEGIAIMGHNRGTERLRDLTRGPGQLTSALRIDRSLDGLDLCKKEPLWLAADESEPGAVGKSVRIGITQEADEGAAILSSGKLRSSAGPSRSTLREPCVRSTESLQAPPKQDNMFHNFRTCAITFVISRLEPASREARSGVKRTRNKAPAVVGYNLGQPAPDFVI